MVMLTMDVHRFAVKTILNASICFNEEWKKNASVLEINGDVLIIPQASLAGKMKGKKLQLVDLIPIDDRRSLRYHGLGEKEDGAKFYGLFVKEVTETLNKQDESSQKGKEGS